MTQGVDACVGEISTCADVPLKRGGKTPDALRIGKKLIAKFLRLLTMKILMFTDHPAGMIAISVCPESENRQYSPRPIHPAT